MVMRLLWLASAPSPYQNERHAREEIRRPALPLKSLQRKSPDSKQAASCLKQSINPLVPMDGVHDVEEIQCAAKSKSGKQASGNIREISRGKDSMDYCFNNKYLGSW